MTRHKGSYFIRIDNNDPISLMDDQAQNIDHFIDPRFG